MKVGFRPPKIEPSNKNSKRTVSFSPEKSIKEERPPATQKTPVTAQDLAEGRPMSLTSKRDAFLYDHAQVIYLIENKTKSRLATAREKSRNEDNEVRRFD